MLQRSPSETKPIYFNKQYQRPFNREELIEKENTCLNLTDIYTKKLRIVEKLDRIRKNFVPVEHNQYKNLNKKLERPFSPWDYVLEEVKLIALDFREERKWKIAMGYHLSKSVKKYCKQKKARGKELNAFHRLISSELASMVYKEFERHWEIKLAERKANAEALEEPPKSERLGPTAVRTDVMIAEGHELEMALPKTEQHMEEEEAKHAEKQNESSKEHGTGHDKTDLILEKIESRNDIGLSREDRELNELSKELEQREDILDVDVLGQNLLDDNALLLTLKTSENDDNKRRNMKTANKKRESGILHQSSFGPFSSGFGGRFEARIKPELEKMMNTHLDNFGIQEKEELKKVDKLALVHELKKLIFRWPKNKNLNLEAVSSVISSFFQIPNAGVGDQLLSLSRSNSISSAFPPPLSSSFSYQNYSTSQQLLLKSSNSTSSVYPDNNKKRKKNPSTTISSFQPQPALLSQSSPVSSLGPQMSSNQQGAFFHGTQNGQPSFAQANNNMMMAPPFIPQLGQQQMSNPQGPLGSSQMQQPSNQQNLLNSGMKEGSGSKPQESVRINFQDASVIKKLKNYENLDEILTLTYDEQNIAEGEYSKLFQVTYDNMNNMPKQWEEVPTYKMYDFLPIEPLYYTETTFDDTVEDINLGSLTLESAIEDYGAKMESLFNSKSTNNANNYNDQITLKRNNKEDINFIEFIKVFPKWRENHLFIHSDASKNGGPAQDTKFKIFRSPPGDKGFMGSEGYTSLPHIDWPPHMYYLLEKYINMFGNKWPLIVECLEINPLSKGYKINEKICLERWFNLNFKRKRKILQLDNVIYPNYTFFEASDFQEESKQPENDQAKEQASNGPLKSILEVKGEISTLENKGNILWKKTNSLFNNDTLVDYGKEPKCRNYKKYCLPMRDFSEVKIYQSNLARSHASYDDKTTEKALSMWHSQMAVMKSDKMKLLNDNLNLIEHSNESIEKLSLESIKSCSLRSEEMRNPSVDFIKPEFKKDFDNRMKRLLPLIQINRRKKQIDRNSPIIQTINNQRRNQQQQQQQHYGVPGPYPMNKLQQVQKIPPPHQQLPKQGQPPATANLMPQGQVSLHQAPSNMTTVPNQVMGPSQGRDHPYLKVLASGNLNANMHDVGQVMSSGGGAPPMMQGYPGPSIPGPNYQNIPKTQPNNMPVVMDNKYSYMPSQPIQQNQIPSMPGMPSMGQQKPNIVGGAQPFQGNYPNPSQNQARMPVGNYTQLQKKDKIPFSGGATQNNMFNGAAPAPPLGNQNPASTPVSSNQISRTGTSKGEEKQLTKQSKKK